MSLTEAQFIIEDKSRTTVGNAANVRRLLLEHRWAKAVIVTSPYHMRRALLLFRRCGANVQGRDAFAPDEYTLAEHCRAVCHEIPCLVQVAARDVYQIPQSSLMSS